MCKACTSFLSSSCFACRLGTLVRDAQFRKKYKSIIIGSPSFTSDNINIISHAGVCVYVTKAVKRRHKVTHDNMCWDVYYFYIWLFLLGFLCLFSDFFFCVVRCFGKSFVITSAQRRPMIGRRGPGSDEVTVDSRRSREVKCCHIIITEITARLWTQAKLLWLQTFSSRVPLWLKGNIGARNKFYFASFPPECA